MELWCSIAGIWKEMNLLSRICQCHVFTTFFLQQSKISGIIPSTFCWNICNSVKKSISEIDTVLLYAAMWVSVSDIPTLKMIQNLKSIPTSTNVDTDRIQIISVTQLQNKFYFYLSLNSWISQINIRTIVL